MIGTYTWERPSLNQQSVIDYFLYCNNCNVTNLYIDDQAYLLDIGSDHNAMVLTLWVNTSPVPQFMPDHKEWWVREINDDQQWELNQLLAQDLSTTKMVDTCSYTTFVQLLKDNAKEVIGIKASRKFEIRSSVEIKRLRQQLRTVKRDFKTLKYTLTGDQKHCYMANLAHLRAKIRHCSKKLTNSFTEKLIKRILANKQSSQMSFYQFMHKVKRPSKLPIVLKDTNGMLALNPTTVKGQLKLFWDNVYFDRYWLYADPYIETQSLYDTPSISPDEKTHLQEEMLGDITIAEIKKAIKQLKNNSSTGATDILPEWLKCLSDANLEYLQLLFQKWWDTGILPPESQISLVSFLYKKGSTSDLGHYRSLSLGCNLCKIYNRILANRLQDFVEKCDILGETQNGFRPNRRTTDNLLILKSIVDNTTLPHNNRRIYCASIDLMKAFDKVWRPALFHKMRAWGIPPKFVSAIENLYANPAGILKWDSVTTDPLNMPTGLKQGCVLSPLLFAIYIADLPRLLQRECCRGASLGHLFVSILSYADDLILIANLIEDFRQILLATGWFLNRWHLTPSTEKSSVIAFGGGVQYNEDRRWYMGSFKSSVQGDMQPLELKEVKSFKYLGIDIVRQLDIVRSAKDNLPNRIQKYKWMTTIPARRLNKQAYYGTKIWDCYGKPAALYGTEVMLFAKSTLRKIDVKHNDILRTLLDFPRCTPLAAIYAECDTIPLTDEIMSRQLNYVNYLENLPASRLVKTAFQVQESISNVRNTSWLGEIHNFRDSLKFVDPNRINKNSIKLAIKKKSHESLRTACSVSNSLRYYKDKLEPKKDFVLTPKSDYSWWLKAKCGGLFLLEKMAGMCPECNTLETVEHFMLSCENSTGSCITTLLPPELINSTEVEKCNYIFSYTRSIKDRCKFGKIIGELWHRRSNIRT